MRIFVDTGAWIAIADRNDQYANVASQFYTDLILQRSKLLTSNLVLVETFNLLSPLMSISSSMGLLFFHSNLFSCY